MNIWKTTGMDLFNRPVLYCFLCLRPVHEVFSDLGSFLSYIPAYKWQELYLIYANQNYLAI